LGFFLFYHCDRFIGQRRGNQIGLHDHQSPQQLVFVAGNKAQHIVRPLQPFKRHNAIINGNGPFLIIDFSASAIEYKAAIPRWNPNQAGLPAASIIKQLSGGTTLSSTWFTLGK
jgi:hypothetical protein